MVRVAIGVVVVVAMAGCTEPDTPEPVASSERHFRALRTEQIQVDRHSTPWRFYVFQHRAGPCFVVIRPPGEGGGASMQVDAEVCTAALVDVEP